MFCPRCSTQNEQQQGYCRQCGQALSGVRLALEGSADPSLDKLKASAKWINGGSATLVAFTLIALAIAVLGVAVHNLSFGYIAFINLILGSFIALPLIYDGKVSLMHTARLLSKSRTESSQPALEHTQRPDDLLTTGLKGDLHRVPVQASVTEDTTLNLKSAERIRRKPN